MTAHSGVFGRYDPHAFPVLEADSNLRLPDNPPEVGQLVQVRQRTWLVQKVTPPPEPNHSARVALACADDDAQGEELEVFAR